MDTEIRIPSTPPPIVADESTAKEDKSAFTSPPPPSSSMTPPPSTQPVRARSHTPRAQTAPDDASILSPPPTVKYTANSHLPSADDIANADLSELRFMAASLVAAVAEARTSAAHFNLQHSLLTIETQEAAQRAEVEHQMTRREVEVLQATEQKHRASMSSASRSSQTPSQTQLDTLTKVCKDLEDERKEVERRLRKAKKLIQMERDRTELLTEENVRLKQRIRENREHFTRLKSISPLYATPRDTFTTPQRKAMPRYTDSTPTHAPFAALLAADQVLSGESLSVPSTPTKSIPSKIKHAHIRGAHSLSSLHTTPARMRPITSDGLSDISLPYSAPGSHLVNESAVRDRRDRDSTISVTDDDAVTSDGESLRGVPQSQASSLATSMLRKNPGSQESLRLSQNAEQSSNLLQTKLFGNVTKPGVGRSTRKRKANSSADAIAAKKAKLAEGVGLGIGAWSPRS